MSLLTYLLRAKPVSFVCCLCILLYFAVFVVRRKMTKLDYSITRYPCPVPVGEEVNVRERERVDVLYSY